MLAGDSFDTTSLKRLEGGLSSISQTALVFKRRFLRSRMITVTTINGELPVQVDGETVCLQAQHLTAEALAGRLEVLCLDKD